MKFLLLVIITQDTLLFRESIANFLLIQEKIFHIFFSLLSEWQRQMERVAKPPPGQEKPEENVDLRHKVSRK